MGNPFILLYISCLYFLIPRLCSRQTIDDAPWLGWKIPGDILNGGCYRTRWEEVGWENDEYEIIINSSLFIKKKNLNYSSWIYIVDYNDFIFFLLWYFTFSSLIFFFIWLFDIVMIWAWALWVVLSTYKWGCSGNILLLSLTE